MTALANQHRRLRELLLYIASGEPDLTNRQMAVMLMVANTPGPHTVRRLAMDLGVQKPVITRALNALGGHGFLRRIPDEWDRRNVFIVATRPGYDFLERVI